MAVGCRGRPARRRRRRRRGRRVRGRDRRRRRAAADSPSAALPDGARPDRAEALREHCSSAASPVTCGTSCSAATLLGRITSRASASTPTRPWSRRRWSRPSAWRSCTARCTRTGSARARSSGRARSAPSRCENSARVIASCVARVDARALQGTDYLYYRARYSTLSRLKDATSGAYAEAERTRPGEGDPQRDVAASAGRTGAPARRDADGHLHHRLAHSSRLRSRAGASGRATMTPLAHGPSRYSRGRIRARHSLETRSP